MPDKPTQAEYWDTRAGEHWSAFADRYDDLLAPFGATIIDAADIRPGQRVLDVGCGNGALALAIAERVGEKGSVVGLDLSGPMLSRAQQRAEAAGRANIRFEKGDAQREPLDAESFDHIVSRFGVMFFDDPTAAFANLLGALRAGGKMTFACWQDAMSNEWIMVPGMAIVQHLGMPELGEPGAPGPFAFADGQRLRSILLAAGFADVAIDPVTLPQRMGSDVEDTVGFLRQTDIAQDMFEGVEPEKVGAAIASITRTLAAYARPDGVYLNGAAWLVTARRVPAV